MQLGPNSRLISFHQTQEKSSKMLDFESPSWYGASWRCTTYACSGHALRQSKIGGQPV